jgi:hypothetical protein
MRVDEYTRWKTVELVSGKVVECATEGERFRIARLVGDLGYAGACVVTDDSQSFPLRNVARLGGQARLARQDQAGMRQSEHAERHA